MLRLKVLFTKHMLVVTKAPTYSLPYIIVADVQVYLLNSSISIETQMHINILINISVQHNRMHGSLETKL